MRLIAIPAVVVATLLAIPTMASAQDAGPRAGSWAAEATPSGEVSLLRFSNSTSAWLVGFGGSYFRHDEESGPIELELTTVTLRLGFRGYRSPEERFRPFHTVAGLVEYISAEGRASPPWAFGGQLEYGGAYFFTPRVSLGTSLELRGMYGRGSREVFGAPETNVTEIRISTGLRFLGAVYF